MDAYNMAMAAAPATRAEPVRTHNSNPLPAVPKALFVGKGGTLRMRGVNDSADRTWKVSAGSYLPFRAEYVRTTGTTATDILALY